MLLRSPCSYLEEFTPCFQLSSQQIQHPRPCSYTLAAWQRLRGGRTLCLEIYSRLRWGFMGTFAPAVAPWGCLDCVLCPPCPNGPPASYWHCLRRPVLLKLPICLQFSALAGAIRRRGVCESLMPQDRWRALMLGLRSLGFA